MNQNAPLTKLSPLWVTKFLIQNPCPSSPPSTNLTHDANEEVIPVILIVAASFRNTTEVLWLLRNATDEFKVLGLN